MDGGEPVADVPAAEGGGVHGRGGGLGTVQVALSSLEFGELDAVVRTVAAHIRGEELQGLGGGGFGVGQATHGLVGDGGQPGDLGGVQET